MTDIFQEQVAMPLGIVHVVKKGWIFGRFMCKLIFFNMYLNWFSSIFLLVIISVDRCVLVMFPVWAQNKRTIRKASVVVMLAWIIAATLSAPSAVFRDIRYDHSPIVILSRLLKVMLLPREAFLRVQ